MKLETPNCPKCEKPANGTMENIQGKASGSVDEDGNFEHEGDTTIYWDSSETNTNEAGEIEVGCENGDTWFTKVIDE